MRKLFFVLTVIVISCTSKAPSIEDQMKDILKTLPEESPTPLSIEDVKREFEKLENENHDPEYKGYLFGGETKSSASSINLLKTFTEYYQVLPEPLIRERLRETLFITRDRFIKPDGDLLYYLDRDWSPLEEDTVGYFGSGDNLKVAAIMLKASSVLGIQNDSTTHLVAKRMTDRYLQKNWIEYDSTVHHYEGIDCLLEMSQLYPNDSMNYPDKFEKSWLYNARQRFYKREEIENCLYLFKSSKK